MVDGCAPPGRSGPRLSSRQWPVHVHQHRHHLPLPPSPWIPAHGSSRSASIRPISTTPALCPTSSSHAGGIVTVPGAQAPRCAPLPCEPVAARSSSQHAARRATATPCLRAVPCRAGLPIPPHPSPGLAGGWKSRGRGGRLPLPLPLPLPP